MYLFIHSFMLVKLDFTHQLCLIQQHGRIHSLHQILKVISRCSVQWERQSNKKLNYVVQSKRDTWTQSVWGCAESPIVSDSDVWQIHLQHRVKTVKEPKRDIAKANGNEESSALFSRCSHQHKPVIKPSDWKSFPLESSSAVPSAIWSKMLK